MIKIHEIKYRDIRQSEEAEQNRLQARLEQLVAIKSKRGVLPDDEEAELLRVAQVLQQLKMPGSLCNPLFVGVRDLSDSKPGLLGGALSNHINGQLKFDPRSNPGAVDFCTAALTFGLLDVDNAAAPPVQVDNLGTPAKPRLVIVADQANPKWSQLSRMFFAALGEAQSMQPLALKVLPLLGLEGDPLGKRGDAIVDAAEFARVMRKLAADGIDENEPQLRRRINEALNIVQNRLSDGTSDEIGIDLPDLEDAAKSSIVEDNVRLMGPMICAAMFDELKVFEVVDKLVELFQQGMLIIGNGDAGKQMYRYWKEAPNRMSDGERRNFYAMTMGIPGGEAGNRTNREFNDLWLRFVSSVSSFVRQQEVDKLLRASVPSPISHQQIRKAARDLAANLSLHGYGMAYHAALDLQAQIKFMIKLLGDREVMANYGARDMWQVVDQVATLELGGAKSSSRYRTLATCGVIITAWLAKNIDKINSPTGSIIDIEEVRQPMNHRPGSKAINDPNDADLVNACLLWLADTATGENVVDQMAQPRETPVMTSRPVQIPAIAREMLADLPATGLAYRGTQH